MGFVILSSTVVAIVCLCLSLVTTTKAVQRPVSAEAQDYGHNDDSGAVVEPLPSSNQLKQEQFTNQKQMQFWWKLRFLNARLRRTAADAAMTQQETSMQKRSNAEIVHALLGMSLNDIGRMKNAGRRRR